MGEVGGIGIVEVAPVAAAAYPIAGAAIVDANTYVVGTTALTVGWPAVYQFVSAFASNSRMPTSLIGLEALRPVRIASDRIRFTGPATATPEAALGIFDFDNDVANTLTRTSY